MRIKTAIARTSAKMKGENLISPNMFSRSKSDLRKNRNLTNVDLDNVTNKDKTSNS